MLTSVFAKTIRDLRFGALAWGLGLGLIVAVGTAQYPQVVGEMGPERVARLNDFRQALQAFSFMTGEVADIGTVGGFITVRALGFVSLLLALWAVICAAGAMRAEEQHGSSEILLSAPVGRASVLLQKMLGLATVFALAAILVLAGMFVGVPIAAENISVPNSLLAMLNIWTLMVLWGAAAMLASQFTLSRRGASALVGGLLFAAYFSNNILESLSGFGAWLWLSPMHYYSISKPLVEGRALEVGPWLAMLSGALLLSAASLAIFTRRDVGSALRLIASRTRGTAAASGGLLGGLTQKAIRDVIPSSLGWGLGLGVYAALVVFTTDTALEPVRKLISEIPMLTAFTGGAATNEGYLGFGFLSYLPALLAIFAILQVASWAEDEEEGRTEVLLSAPVPRWRALLARYMALLLSAIVVLALSAVGIYAAAGPAGVSYSSDIINSAIVAALPTVLVIGLFGLGLAAWLPRPGAAVVITSGVVAAMFFLEMLGPLLKLPDAVVSLSVFHVYGRPGVQPVNWAGMWVLTGVSVVLGAVGLAGVTRRDITK